MASQPSGSFDVVMFDFDGTLVDTMGGFADVAGRLIQHYHGWSFADARAAYLRTSGIPFFQQLELLFPGHERNPGLAETFEYRKLSCYDQCRLDPEAGVMLDGLRQRGIRSVVSSNNFTSVVDAFLARQDARFDLVLGYSDNFGKGEEHFAFTAQRLQVPRSSLLFVGDSLQDAQFALDAGVAFAGKLGTHDAGAFEARFGADPFPLVQGLAEILDIVDGAAPGAERSRDQYRESA